MKGGGGGGADVEEGLGLPPGFRFHPTDEELVIDYLCRKCAGLPICVPIIADIDLYKFDPWHLPGMASYGEKEWYFFTPRDRKYPNGSRPNRAAGTGYWKATGADKPVGKPKSVGIKKALVFYAGKPPTGTKTNWIMHEYRLANVDRSPGPKNKNLRLDDWVLCRIYNKKGVIEKHFTAELKSEMEFSEFEDRKPQILSGAMLPWLPPQSPLPNTSGESFPRLHTDSSGSGPLVSAEFSGDKEVQSAPKWNVLSATRDEDYHQINYIDYGFQDPHDHDPFASQMQQLNDDDHLLPLDEMFMFMHNPF